MTRGGPALWTAQARIPSVAGDRIEVVGGSGSYVTTADGRRLLDATAALWYANIGHGRRELADAAHAQMTRLETYHVFGRFVNDRALELAERLAVMAPIDDAKIFLTSGGSDSIDTACKLARRHWQLEGRGEKTVVLSRDEAYHGLHGFGTAVAGIEANRVGYGTESLIPETARVDNRDVARVREQIEAIGPHRVAAILVEPVMGTGGVIPPAPGYLEGIQRLAREHDFLVIADEVITGFGRVGTMFASERYGIAPDIVTFAKGVTSGYAALGGIMVAPRIWERFFEGDDAPIFRHGLTYSGHATACAVAMANLDILEHEGLVARAGELEVLLDAALEPLRHHELVDEVRIGGLMAGIELHEAVDPERLARVALDAGVILRILQGRIVQISPPFVTSDDDIGRIAQTVLDALPLSV